MRRLLLVVGALICCIAGGASMAAERFVFRVVQSYPHDTGAFTQGLVYRNGRLYESVGGYGESAIREVNLATGKIVRERRLPSRVFAEGLTWHDNRLIQLTWRAGAGIVYEPSDFTPRAQFRYRGEGWGLTDDGERLIMSDGSDELRFLDPLTFEETGRVRVRDGDTPVDKLNELEFIDGYVYANIWLSDAIARIDPDTGEIQAWIDLAGLLPSVIVRDEQDVLNGIAYDAEGKRLFATGKRWPRLYEIEIVPAQP